MALDGCRGKVIPLFLQSGMNNRIMLQYISGSNDTICQQSFCFHRVQALRLALIVTIENHSRIVPCSLNKTLFAGCLHIWLLTLTLIIEPGPLPAAINRGNLSLTRKSRYTTSCAPSNDQDLGKPRTSSAGPTDKQRGTHGAMCLSD